MKPIFLRGFGLVLMLTWIPSGTQAEPLSVVEVPCGHGFLNPCKEVIDKILYEKKSVGPGGKEMGWARDHLKRFVAFLYNDGTKPKITSGKDDKGNEVIKRVDEEPVLFPNSGDDGHVVDLSSSSSPLNAPVFGKPCSRCETMFNQESRELVSDYKGRSCGTGTTVRVTLGGTYVNLGTNTYAWYRGFYTYVLSEVAKTTMDEIKNSAGSNNGRPQIPVSEGCQTFAQSLHDLLKNKNSGVEYLEKTLGKTGELEILKHDAKFQEFLSTHPDQGHLRNLAQELKTLVDATERAAGFLTLCTIYDRAGIQFRNRVGTWDQFFSPQVVADINARVRSKVLSACSGACKLKGLAKHIGRCLACLNSHANRFTPPEIENLFDKKCQELEAL